MDTNMRISLPSPPSTEKDYINDYNDDIKREKPKLARPNAESTSATASTVTSFFDEAAQILQNCDDTAAATIQVPDFDFIIYDDGATDDINFEAAVPPMNLFPDLDPS
ncbi:hypothetical protein EC973_007354 [Apophysomyces ossiformis]|uniref:Uncharacterized protein n=1 Tax=Apophysomyces ossiformis TaxID=679940 RepID=A0A8H7BPY3_9FUNG|nr:hypothetical protein EC973_007354 [Apophysomyces ossiformis]